MRWNLWPLFFTHYNILSFTDGLTLAVRLFSKAETVQYLLGKERFFLIV